MLCTYRVSHTLELGFEFPLMYDAIINKSGRMCIRQLFAFYSVTSMKDLANSYCLCCGLANCMYDANTGR